MLCLLQNKKKLKLFLVNDRHKTKIAVIGTLALEEENVYYLKCRINAQQTDILM